MTLSTEERLVLSAYRPSEFLPMKAKHLYGLRGAFKRRFYEQKRFASDLFDAVRSTGYRVGPLAFLKGYGESVSDFLDRLFAQLTFHREISMEEHAELVISLKEGKELPFLLRPRARALTLKVFLELSRRGHPSCYDVALIPENLRTVAELLSMPYEIPFPAGKDDFLTNVYRQWEMGFRPSGFLDPFTAPFIERRFGAWSFGREALDRILEARRAWLNKDTVEAHLAKAVHFGDIEYDHAVHIAAVKYPSLPIAYSDQVGRIDRDAPFDVFVSRYHSYRKSVLLPE